MSIRDSVPLNSTPSIWNGDTWATRGKDNSSRGRGHKCHHTINCVRVKFHEKDLFRKGAWKNENLFVEMIQKSSPVSKVRIKQTLEKIVWGVQLLKKVSLDTVINRIKYERCLRRASKWWMFKVKIKIALLKFVIVKAKLIYCYNDGRCFISYVYLISWDSQCDCIWIIFNEF